jgi:hypothetical protein
MKRLSLILSPLVLIVAAATSARAGDDPFRMVPPDAVAVVGFDWKAFAASPAGRGLETQFKQGLAAQGAKVPAGMADWFKLLVGQVDKVVLAMPAAPGEDQKGGVPLLIIQGKFNVADLRARTQPKTAARPETYRSVELFRSKGAESPSYRVAYPDVNTILMGDRKFVRSAIDRWYQESKETSSPVVERARAIQKTGQLWISATITEEFAKELKGNPVAAALAADLDTIDGAMSFEEGFALALHLGAKSDESAEKIKAMLQAGLAAIAPSAPAESAEILKRVTISRNESLVRLSLGLSQNEVAKLMESAHIAPGGGGQEIASAAPGPAPAHGASHGSAQPRRDAKIRIYGLDEGVREIPLHSGLSPK